MPDKPDRDLLERFAHRGQAALESLFRQFEDLAGFLNGDMGIT
jgi:hypothetical protein